MNRKVFAILVTCLVVLSLGTVACSQQEAPKKTIKVGIIGPMKYIQGEHHWLGATMAADEINAKGGIAVGQEKRTIELVKVDSNEILSVPDAASAMEKAITADKVDFLTGGFRSEGVLAMQEVAADNKKIFLGTGAAHPELNARVDKDYNRFKYWFRVTPINSNDLGKVDFLLLQAAAKVLKAELGIDKPKVAIIAEKAVWADPIIDAAKQNIPKMGMEIVGEWRPSATATDLTAELSAIASSGAHIIFTSFSGPAGIPYAKQRGELKIPALSVGINVEAQKEGFWEAAGGQGNYEATMNTYARVKITEATIPFYEKFIQASKQFPTYNAGTYEALYILQAAIEKAGTIDSDKVVEQLEKTDRLGTAGRLVFTKNHDVTFGPGYVTGLGVQWQDGKLQPWWPDGWEGITYEGTAKLQIPPWMVSKYKR